jgi:hypothetical protein
VKSGISPLALRRAVVAVWLAVAVLVVMVAYRLLFAQLLETGEEMVPDLPSTAVIEVPGGHHAYRYVAAPNLTWAQAKAEAAKLSWQGHPGYLATIDDEAEFDFVMKHVFPDDTTNVTYLGGRQTAPGEWRWVTGPDAAADGGKGLLFWTGYQNGSVVDGHYANWMNTAFHYGGRWDVHNVCCVTIFSYRKRQFSTSLGTGYWEEGVAGYLVEFGS